MQFSLSFPTREREPQSFPRAPVSTACGKAPEGLQLCARPPACLARHPGRCPTGLSSFDPNLFCKSHYYSRFKDGKSESQLNNVAKDTN